MLQQLATQTGAQAWAIASLIFFLGVFLVVMVRTFRTPPGELAARARLPLDDDPGMTDVPGPADGRKG